MKPWLVILLSLTLTSCSFFNPVVTVYNHSRVPLEQASIEASGNTFPLGHIPIRGKGRTVLIITQDTDATLRYYHNGKLQREVIGGYLTRGYVGNIIVTVTNDGSMHVEDKLRIGF